MNRTTRFGPRFMLDVKRLSPDASKRLAREVAKLASSALPTALDFETALPPVDRAWVRRVPQANVWVLFRWDEHQVTLLRVLLSPPVPVDGT